MRCRRKEKKRETNTRHVWNYELISLKQFMRSSSTHAENERPTVTAVARRPVRIGHRSIVLRIHRPGPVLVLLPQDCLSVHIQFKIQTGAL